jgi:hypothetical protein
VDVTCQEVRGNSMGGLSGEVRGKDVHGGCAKARVSYEWMML